MLGKLIKHEFKATGRTMLPALGVFAVLAVVANVGYRFLSVSKNSVINAMLTLFIVLFFVAVAAAGLVTVVIMINRFYKNLLQNEGYLMLTLPVNIHQLMWSKLIVSLVWFVATAAVVVLIIVLTIVNFSHMELARLFAGLPTFTQLLELIRAAGFRTFRLIFVGLEFLALCITAGLCFCLHFYAAISIGHCFTNHKGLWSVLSYICISIVTSLCATKLTSLAPSSAEIEVLVGLMIAFEVVIGAAFYLISTHSLRRGLNLA